MDVSTMKLINDYGVAIVALVVVAGFLGTLIWYILKQNKNREDNYITLVTNDLKHIAEFMLSLTSSLNNFTINSNDAHKYQREEHNNMIENQNKISISIEKTNLCLEQVEKGLNKINGHIT